MSNVRVTISACILARNEQRQIADALRSLQEWTDQILVIDNESDDDTAAIARRFTDFVLTAPRAGNFDALRNLAIEHARGDWIFYLFAKRGLKKFHRVGCVFGERIRPDDRVGYPDAAAATAAGLEPCKVCRPE